MPVGLWPQDEPVRLNLAVKAAVDGKPVEDLNVADLVLYVNEKETVVQSLVKRERAMSLQAKSRRIFVLSFNIHEYGKKISEAVSYLLTEVFAPSDLLFVSTPARLYKIEVSGNKLKMIRDIQTLVVRDCAENNKVMAAARKKLENHIKTLQNIIKHPYQAPGVYIGTSSFLTTYPGEYLRYGSQYLLPGVNKFRQILRELTQKEGNPWCIHFQQGEIYDIYYKTKEMVRVIMGMMTHSVHFQRTFQNPISSMQNNLLALSKTASRNLSDLILEGNINFSTIFFGVRGEGRAKSETTIHSPFETPLVDAVRVSGGKVLVNTGPLRGVQRLVEHEHIYYQLSFNFNGQIENKKIRLHFKNKKGNLYYKKSFSSQEVAEKVKFIETEKIRLSNILQVESRLLFSINNFKLNRRGEELFGVLKIRIQLFDEQGGDVYDSQKTMRANKKEISITHVLPYEHYGAFRLVITAHDLLTGSVARVERAINID